MIQNQPCRDVLVVDDAETIRRFLKVSLEREGYSVRVAEDASEAQKAVLEQLPHYIISDWQMPNMTGGELCEWLRKQSLPSYVYFILVTAHDKAFDLIDGLDAGADDYVKKPLNVEELMARLRCGERILNLERRLRTLAAQEAHQFMQELT